MTDIPQPPNHAHGDYTGSGKALFFLAFRTTLLTIFTLGIYRFWAKTRIRRFIWSAVRIDGSRFEYTGTGLEKFLGFLMAVVFLALYLGLIQILLAWFGMTLLSPAATPEGALLQTLGASLTGLATVPFLFFAIYRARRYRMARTRWRGIRFGMEPAAWGYAFRAMAYWALTLLSLGLLTPLMTFRLERYMTDRTWFGDERFVQGGRWTALYAAMKHLGIGLALVLGGGALLGLGAGVGPNLLGGLALAAGLVWLPVGVISYRVQGFAILTRHKRLGEDITFEAQPSTKTVILTYVVGAIGLAVALSVVTGIFAGAVAGVLSLTNLDTALQQMPAGAVIAGIIAVLGYLLTLAAARAGALAAITQPILRHYVTSVTLVNLAALQGIHQRAGDAGADAEGFADALDIGGAL
ncbi:hypothetical protein GCM10011415_19400 [Salipiger pallidus]|uniref:DUF898 domain-containing protein n=1 Tax=Salipiger pallidus TaxID=1775170 RepID=A0A8J2ZJT0_9RHOB|nr:DUF898 family protein [Salipiger pallidus]GGG71617.1 hypothetical protein GCM10011415_19400 [Salipiger pallidus]